MMRHWICMEIYLRSRYTYSFQVSQTRFDAVLMCRSCSSSRALDVCVVW